MRKVLSLIIGLLLIFSSLCYAQDYWVYIRTYDKPTVDSEQVKQGTYGRSKKGDIVAILPVTPKFIPSETEKQSYCIIKVIGLSDKDIKKYSSIWQEQVGVDSLGEAIYKKKADKQYTLDIDSLNLQIGLYPNPIKFSTVKRYLRQKTKNDLIAYRWGYRQYAYINKPLKKLFNLIIPKAYAETVSTCNWASEDYNTIALWEAAKDGDLVTDTRQETLECYDDDGQLIAVYSDIQIDDSITDSTYYMKITVPVGERHTGTLPDGTSGNGAVLYDNDDRNTWVLNILDQYTEIEWLCFDIDRTTYDGNWVIALNDGYIRLSNLILGISGSKKPKMISFNNGLGSTEEQYVTNCIVIGGAPGISGGGGVENFIYNSTFYNCVNGVYVYHYSYNSTIKAYNVISVGNSGIDFYEQNSSSSIIGTNNCDEDGTGLNVAPATGSITTTQTLTTEFFTSATDMHLVSGSDAIDAGADFGTSPTRVNIDIDNRDRDAQGDTWDMGADEFVVAAGATRRVIFISKSYDVYKHFVLALRSILS